MKKLLTLLSVFVLGFALTACTNDDDKDKEVVGCETGEAMMDGECTALVDGEFVVAMITDSGTIDDESFNQGTWEGIMEYCDDNGLTYKYYKPAEVSDDAYLGAIQLAILGGAKVVVTPGFLFESSVYAAQDLYPDVKFILIDGTPHDPTWSTWKTADNTLPILFNEHESGFLAGYAAVKDGFTDLGFMGGMAVPAVVKFGIGFIAGAYYAAEEDGVTLDFSDDTYEYLGDFAPSDNHKTKAAGWYTTGTEIIFAAAGGAGSSVMAAAEDTSNYMIGVDIDQAGQSNRVLTSAMKQLGVAVQQGLASWSDGTFVGGTTSFKSAANDGVALPMATSQFAVFTQADYDAIYAVLAADSTFVPADYDALALFLFGLGATGYPTQDVVVPPSN